jgi:hypothetical protein
MTIHHKSYFSSHGVSDHPNLLKVRIKISTYQNWTHATKNHKCNPHAKWWVTSPKSSTTIHEISQGRTSQPNKIKIETPKIDDEALPTLSLASISCTQQNGNEDIFEKETTTKKEQVKEYISPHLRKVDKTQVPRKERRKPTIPLATMTRKL